MRTRSSSKGDVTEYDIPHCLTSKSNAGRQYMYLWGTSLITIYVIVLHLIPMRDVVYMYLWGAAYLSTFSIYRPTIGFSAAKSSYLFINVDKSRLQQERQAVLRRYLNEPNRSGGVLRSFSLTPMFLKSHHFLPTGVGSRARVCSREENMQWPCSLQNLVLGKYSRWLSVAQFNMKDRCL